MCEWAWKVRLALLLLLLLLLLLPELPELLVQIQGYQWPLLRNRQGTP